VERYADSHIKKDKENHNNKKLLCLFQELPLRKSFPGRAFDSAKNDDRQRHKRQSVTAKVRLG